MKKIILLAALVFISGCMKPHIMTMHQNGFTLMYDPALDDAESSMVVATELCKEKFGLSVAEQTNKATNGLGPIYMSYNCK